MIVGALLARNEAAEDRYLRRAITNAQQFCDEIVVLDDGSTDETAQIAEELGCILIAPSDCCHGFWGDDERPARITLWDAACARAGPGGWVYIFDADHELLGITPEEFRHLCASRNVTAWSFFLWDCWDSDTQHRVDGYWQAWHVARPWLFKVPPKTFTPDWGDRHIHAGHCPKNFPLLPGMSPSGCGIRHLGYVKQAHRLAKANRYLQLVS